MPCYPGPNQIGSEEATRGTETSKYPEEQKSTEIARVAASESAPAQTHARASLRALLHAVLWDRPFPGPQTWGGVTKLRGSGTAWKGRPQRVRAPYAKPRSLRGRHPSSAGHVKSGTNPGGPPSKAEYSPVTDSEPVPGGKGEKHPERGVKQYLKPCAYKQSEHSCSVTACLL